MGSGIMELLQGLFSSLPQLGQPVPTAGGNTMPQLPMGGSMPMNALERILGGMASQSGERIGEAMEPTTAEGGHKSDIDRVLQLLQAIPIAGDIGTDVAKAGAGVGKAAFDPSGMSREEQEEMYKLIGRLGGELAPSGTSIFGKAKGPAAAAAKRTVMPPKTPPTSTASLGPEDLPRPGERMSPRGSLKDVKAAEQAVPLSLAQKTQSEALQSVEAALGGSITGAKPFNELRGAAHKAVGDLVESVRDLMIKTKDGTPGRFQHGDDMIDAFEDGMRTLKGRYDKLYDPIWTKHGSTTVSLRGTELEKVAARLRQEISGLLAKMPEMQPVMDSLNKILGPHVPNRGGIRAPGVKSTIWNLHNSKGVVGKLIDSTKVPTAGRWKEELYRAFDDTLIDMLKKQPGGAKAASDYGRGAKLWAEAHEIADDKFIKAVIESGDSGVTSRLVSELSPDKIATMHRMVGNKAWQHTQRRIFEDILDKAKTDVTMSLGDLIGEHMIGINVREVTHSGKALRKQSYDVLGDERMKAIFSREQRVGLHRLARTMDRLGTGGANSINGMMINAAIFYKGLRATTALSAGAAAMTGVGLIAPRVVARVLTSQKGMNALEKLWRHAKGSANIAKLAATDKTIATAATQLGRLIAQAQKDEERETKMDTLGLPPL